MYIENRLKKMTIVLFIIIILIIILILILLNIFKNFDPKGMDSIVNFTIRIIRFLFNGTGVALNKIKNEVL